MVAAEFEPARLQSFYCVETAFNMAIMYVFVRYTYWGSDMVRPQAELTIYSASLIPKLDVSLTDGMVM